jgi:hypothetical protein
MVAEGWAKVETSAVHLNSAPAHDGQIGHSGLTQKEEDLAKFRVAGSWGIAKFNVRANLFALRKAARPGSLVGIPLIHNEVHRYVFYLSWPKILENHRNPAMHDSVVSVFRTRCGACSPESAAVYQLIWIEIDRRARLAGHPERMQSGQLSDA